MERSWNLGRCDCNDNYDSCTVETVGKMAPIPYAYRFCMRCRIWCSVTGMYDVMYKRKLGQSLPATKVLCTNCTSPSSGSIRNAIKWNSSFHTSWVAQARQLMLQVGQSPNTMHCKCEPQDAAFPVVAKAAHDHTQTNLNVWGYHKIMSIMCASMDGHKWLPHKCQRRLP